MVFNGFCHRPFDENRDGWLDVMPSQDDYPVMAIVNDINAMYSKICELAKENWELKKRIKQLESTTGW